MGKPRKEFWDERSRKLNKKQRKRSRRHYFAGMDNNIEKVKRYEYSPDYIFEVPECFSFIMNLEGTAQFFGNMLNRFEKSMPKANFMIETRNVSTVTIDAIMYLIALMRNHKESRKRLYTFQGTYPLNENAKKAFMESGLLRFVKSKTRKLPENNSKMAILCGKDSNTDSAKQICQFVVDKMGVTRSYINDLYEVIIEMMSNVFYHAYNEEGTMIPEWYMYAEYIDNKIKFLFLDTGFGIGRTVKKHSLYEKVIEKIGMGSESKLIKSALDGEFRTQTEKDNHGKGLPSIKEFALNDKIEEFHIISGKGHCWTDGCCKVYAEELRHRICGTVYSFVMKKLEV